MSVTRGQCEARASVALSQPEGHVCCQLYCLVTGAHVYKQLARGFTNSIAQRPGLEPATC